MRERRPGVWELIVQLPRETPGERARQLSRTVHGTKRDAQRALAQLVSEVSAGKITSTATTLDDLLRRWLDHIDGELSPTTLREYRRLVAKRIGPQLGSLRLSRVTARRLDSYYASLRREEGLAPGSVRKIHAVLRGALGQAVRWGMIPSNPAVNASPPRTARSDVNPPQLDEAVRLLRAADEYSIELGTMLRVLAATGARRGEVCGLRWSDIDWRARTISIERSVASIPGGTMVKGTKTHSARRIAVDAGTLAVLERLQRDREQMARMCERQLDPDGFVFSLDPTGAAPLHPDTVTKTFDRLRRSLGLRTVRLHDLRHLHATQLLAAGVPVRTVSGRLGHANAATTLNVYAHFLEASDRQASDVIAGLLGSASDDRPSTE